MNVLLLVPDAFLTPWIMTVFTNNATVGVGETCAMNHSFSLANWHCHTSLNWFSSKNDVTLDIMYKQQGGGLIS